ncbi:hypothetical protein [Spiroplasma endosymbiont of Amphimallon solstitiale]|uniref:hypothetical protein n=1 Tax=Spiroplasma endosymbiont of Amphimallon solstitiale TaxID=3066288 RepID=UPI00313E561E
MWFKFAKLFFVVNTSVQAPTSLIASNDPNVVNYDITKEMVKHVKYHNFDDWATIPWNSFNYVEKYGWPKIIHQFTLKILFLIKNLLKVTLFSVKIL